MSEAPARIGMRPPHPGSFIREEILDELGLSIPRAAEILGVRRATLSRLENDRVSAINLAVLEKLADLLKVEPGFLLSRNPPRRTAK